VGSYSVELTPSAERDLERVDDKKTRQKIVKRLCALADDPRGYGCEKLAGRGDRYRARQGDFRILYEIREVVKVVAVFRIGNRREVYR
jgi:mRNA interferase RelE/StbE